MVQSILRASLVVPLFLAFLLPARVVAQELLSTINLRENVDLSGLELSPDGKHALVLVSRQNYDSNDFSTELLMIAVDSREQRTLSRRDGISMATWSPAGDRIAFLETVNDVDQVFVLSLRGGKVRQITRSKGGVLGYSWSPDGEKFALLSSEDPIIKTGPERFNDSFEVGSNDYLTVNAATRNYAGVVETRGGGEIKRLTPPGMTVATDFSNSSLSWSPNGRQLAVTTYPSPRSGDSDLGKTYLLDIDSGALQPLTSNEDKEGPAYFLPGDESKLVYLYPRDGVPANVAEVYAANPGSSTSSVTGSLDREILDFEWFSSGLLLVTGYDGLQSALWAQTGKDSFKKLDTGEVMEVYELSVSKTDSVALIGKEKYRPAEIYFLSSIESQPERLTDFHDSLAERKQGIRKGISWNSTSGLEADGVLTYPPDFDASKEYPLVLLIHGGPTAASTLSFNMIAQLMAARGWVVLQPNYRGSNHRGNVFQSAIASDAGEGPGADVWSGVETMKKEAYIDPARIAISGWSYGGWMTAWMIGRYPGVWAAAVAGAAPVDYTDMYSLSDLNRMRRHAINASPYVGDNLKSAQEQSPMRNFSAIRTPTLILSKSADSRVSITGSYKLFDALRDNGVQTQFIVYPGAGHLVTDPVRSQDVHERWLDWLSQYLQPSAD